MILSLEKKKLKRTGFFPSFLCGTVISCLVPVLNMAVRSELYTGLEGNPLEILLDANWQMMEMLNIFLIVTASCIMYHTEYADHALQKMNTLPQNPCRMFLSKALLMFLSSSAMLLAEFLVLILCVRHWFPGFRPDSADYLKYLGYSVLLILPAILFMLLIASLCENMWISLGIGVICVFITAISPSGNFVLSLFPFTLAFQTLHMADTNIAAGFSCAAVLETTAIGLAKYLILKKKLLLIHPGQEEFS